MLSNHYFIWLYFAVVLSCLSCNSGGDKPGSKSSKLFFEDVVGVKFVEVRREFENGISFSKSGFQQVPEWDLYFLPGDSVKIYSPFKKKYIFYPIHYDHGEVINFAGEWLRLMHVSKDSLVLQLLEVQSEEVKRDLSNVYMRFYSKSHIEDVLHTTATELRRPSQRDTVFIKKLVDRANKYAHNFDSVFASRTPVKLESRSSLIDVARRLDSKDELDYSVAHEYLYPEYDISIRKAYKDFVHNFTVLVDSKGQMTVGRFAVLEKEFEAQRRKTLQGIVDVYLENLVKITPGHTLGMPHASEIMLHVKGVR